VNTIFAALISGGWATAIAALGFWFNRVSLRAVNRNAMNTLDADHAARLWEKRAEIYVDTLKALADRRDIRVVEADGLLGYFQDPEEVRQEIGDIRTPDWRELESRTVAYASPEVVDALKEANKKEAEFQVLLEDRKNPPPATRDNPFPMPSSEKVREAAIEANYADLQLWNTVQVDLHRKPSEALAREPVSIEPSWTWSRRSRQQGSPAPES
jgi:hypothetical protein